MASPPIKIDSRAPLSAALGQMTERRIGSLFVSSLIPAASMGY